MITNQFGPEYGRNAGSVVNVITKSGTNAWHGSIYGTENNSILNSMSNFNKQFGGNPLTHPPRLKTNSRVSPLAVPGEEQAVLLWWLR